MRALPATLALLLMGAASPDASGLYEGTAKSSDGTATEITLNLICAGDSCKAQFFTSVGDFDGSDARVAGGHVTITFDNGVGLGTADLTAGGGALAGAFLFAGDKGTIRLARKGDALAPDAMNPRLDLTPAQWHEDVRALALELPRHHANAFFSLSKSDFDAEIARLDARAASANGDEMFVGLQQIAKSIGDGHTGVTAPADRRAMPLAIARFGDDFRIVSAGPGLERALGARVLEIGGMPVLEVWSRVMTLTPRAELDALRAEDALVYLARGYALHGLDVIPDRNHAVYTLEDDNGRVFDVDVQGSSAGENPPMTSLVPASALRFQKPDTPFWCDNLETDHAVYCAWRSYQDLHANAAAMFALVASAKAQKLIIDMRDNGGGDNAVGYAELVAPIAQRRDLNARGHLYVLIGPLTFSAAMNNAAQFQDETRAILVGQTIGERPNSYQEPRQFRLPNSHLVVRASTLWYAFRKTGPNVVAPEKEIAPTWDDTKAGRDPVLDWVLAAKS